MSNTNKMTHNQAVLNRIRIRNKANNVIRKHHAGQKRKDGEDFVNHPIRVSKIISESLKHSESLDNCYIAGLLHDTIEDTDYTEKKLLADFGDEIYKIVMECTEDKTKSWKERKKHTIKNLNKISLEGIVVILADKIDNLNSLTRTIEQQNISIEELFKTKFNSPLDEQRWYYSQIYLKALKTLFTNNEYNNTRLLNSNFDKNQFINLLKQYKTTMDNSLFVGEMRLKDVDTLIEGIRN